MRGWWTGLVRAGASLLLALALCHADSAAAQSTRPNIVIVLADDMGFSDVGPYGGEIRTPTLDRLSANGLRFTQFYTAARCVPTRASLLTGLYNHHAGLGLMEADMGVPGYEGELNDHTVTVAEVLRRAGYGTYMAGKWHLSKHYGQWGGIASDTLKHGWPLQRGFDRFYGTIHGAGSYYGPVTLVDGDLPVDPDPGPYYYTDAITDRAVSWIGDHVRSNPERPFFLYVSYTVPHWPLHAPEEDVADYARRFEAGWDALREERYRRLIAMGLIDPAWPLSPRDPRVPAWDELSEHDRRWYARAMAVYAAQVDRMDRGIGRIVAALEESGEFENTLILFLSDNGADSAEFGPVVDSDLVVFQRTTRDGRPVHVGNDHSLMPGGELTYQAYGRGWANASNTPFRLFKGFHHEGGIATPLIAHWPSRIRGGGAITREAGHVIDIMATAVELAGATYPRTFGGRAIHPLEGRSLLPVLEGRSVGPRALFWEHQGNRAVRRGRWKLVSRFADDRPGVWELYDLEADRTETTDLATHRPDLIQDLSAAWHQWAERTGVLPWHVVNPRSGD